MKTKLSLSLLSVLFLGVVNAQVPIAPDPETEGLRAASRETDPLIRIQKLLEFEKNFPNSKLLPAVYESLLGLLHQRTDYLRIEEVGERALRMIPDNTMILMFVSRNYGLQKKNLDRAVQYAQRADELLELQKGEQPYHDDPKWKAYIDSVSIAARANMLWIKSLIN